MASQAKIFIQRLNFLNSEARTQMLYIAKVARGEALRIKSPSGLTRSKLSFIPLNPLCQSQ
jgi:hypothetical protein